MIQNVVYKYDWTEGFYGEPFGLVFFQFIHSLKLINVLKDSENQSNTTMG